MHIQGSRKSNFSTLNQSEIQLQHEHIPKNAFKRV